MRRVSLGLLLMSLLAVAVSSVSAQSGRPPMGETVALAIEPVLTDEAYADQSDAQVLDLYVPEGEGTFPLVIFIHGGAFRAGDKSMLPGTAANLLLENGYAVATINYRLTGEAIFPAQIQDVKAAIRWLRANAETYGLDGERFAVWGQSAGGNLAALAGTSGGVEALEDLEQGNPDVSSTVQAVIDQFGPIDFAALDAQFAADSVCDASAETHDAADSPESVLVGGPVQEMTEAVTAANPTTYLDEDDPPFLIQHGEADCLIAVQQSIDFAAAVSETLGEDQVTLTLFPEAGHGGSDFDSAENAALMLEFLNLHLADEA